MTDSEQSGALFPSCDGRKRLNVSRLPEWDREMYSMYSERERTVCNNTLVEMVKTVFQQGFNATSLLPSFLVHTNVFVFTSVWLSPTFRYNQLSVVQKPISRIVSFVHSIFHNEDIETYMYTLF